jgi:acetylornithine deacetylase/succinyl-diaminopimelate desuccinylase-like protein
MRPSQSARLRTTEETRVNDMVTDVRAWFEAAQAVQSETVALRRAIHAEPELGLHTPKTLAKVRAMLAGLPLDWKTGSSTTGAVAVLRGAKPGRTVLLRGDMDALPMPEDTGLPFESKVEGTMHACGHDTHTAMLASAARVLCARRESLAGTVLFMFQPGEEGFHGARFMLDDGLLDNPAPDAAFALHIMPNAPAGTFGAKAGPMLASADKLIVRVQGKGGHASMPHHAIDPCPGRLRDRDRAPGVRHAPHRHLRSGRDHDRQDRRRLHQQRDSRVGQPARHHPHAVGGDAHGGARRASCGLRRTSPARTSARPKSRSSRGFRSPYATRAPQTSPSRPSQACSGPKRGSP